MEATKPEIMPVVLENCLYRFKAGMEFQFIAVILLSESLELLDQTRAVCSNDTEE
jgi:hypothetical protein